MCINSFTTRPVSLYKPGAYVATFSPEHRARQTVEALNTEREAVLVNMTAAVYITRYHVYIRENYDSYRRMGYTIGFRRKQGISIVSYKSFQ